MITNIQSLVLRTIQEHWRAHGECPTYQAVADELKMHKSTVEFHVERLRQAGELEQGSRLYPVGLREEIIGHLSDNESEGPA